jgi:hypothetical protein
MARSSRWILAGLLLVAAAGCELAGGYSLVEPGRHQFDDEFSVSSKLAWSQLAFGERHVWTIDGAGLEAVWFYAGIEDGDALITNVDQDEDAPRFDSDMRPNEVMELVVDSLGLIGSVNVEGTGLRPAEFGSVKGFRFELTLQTQEGLIKRGLAVGAMQDGKLQLIVYLAADLYYYDKYLDEVENILASVEMI